MSTPSYSKLTHSKHKVKDMFTSVQDGHWQKIKNKYVHITNKKRFNFQLWRFQTSLETVLTQAFPQLLFLAAGHNLHHTRSNTLQYVTAATCCCCLKFPRRQFLISPQRSHRSDLQLSSFFLAARFFFFLLLYKHMNSCWCFDAECSWIQKQNTEAFRGYSDAFSLVWENVTCFQLSEGNQSLSCLVTFTSIHPSNKNWQL